MEMQSSRITNVGHIHLTLSSTSVWRRGRWDEARRVYGFMGLLREWFRGNLSPLARGESETGSVYIDRGYGALAAAEARRAALAFMAVR